MSDAVPPANSPQDEPVDPWATPVPQSNQPPTAPGYGQGTPPPGYGQPPAAPGYGQGTPPAYGQIPPAAPSYGQAPPPPPGYGQAPAASGYGQAPPPPPPGYNPPSPYGQPPVPPGYGPPSGYGQVPPGAYGGPAAQTDFVQNSGKSTAVLALGITSILTSWICALGIIPGIIALVLAGGAQKEIDASGGRIGGSGSLTGGKVCAWIGIGLAALVIIIGIVSFSVTSELENGTNY